MYKTILSWCGKRHAKFYLGFLSFIEAIFFPIPPDVMLAPMVLAKPKQAWQLAAITMSMSVAGGAIGYGFGYFAFDSIGAELLSRLNLESVYAEATKWFHRYGFFAILIAGVTPIPYKVFTLAAGATQMFFISFVMASILSRSFRFYIVAGCMRYFGQSISLSKKHITAIFLVVMMLVMGCMGPARIAPMETRALEPIRSGIHYVTSGDTLYSIAWRYDRDYRELADLNHLSEPYRLRVGQALKLGGSSLVSNPPSLRFEAVKSSQPSLQVNIPPSIKVSEKTNIPKKLPMVKGRWMWPLEGRILSGFITSGPKMSKGVDIEGIRGSSVHATSGGKVVYAGNGLRGYGNLIIIKHDNDYLSAYAHNERLLAKEGGDVKQGDIIATVGGTESDRSKLHFEIRYRGQPVDPLKYLPNLGR